jgi:hypothetical protein
MSSESCGGNKKENLKSLGIAGTLAVVAAIIKRAFKTPKTPQSLSKQEILLGAKFREGLSAIDIASKIIARKKEIGVGIGPLPSGAQNIDLQMEAIRVEEIVNAILTKMKIEGAIPPGIPIQATGGNAGGPIVVVGTTIDSAKVDGVAH